MNGRIPFWPTYYLGKWERIGPDREALLRQKRAKHDYIYFGDSFNVEKYAPPNDVVREYRSEFNGTTSTYYYLPVKMRFEGTLCFSERNMWEPCQLSAVYAKMELGAVIGPEESPHVIRTMHESGDLGANGPVGITESYDASKANDLVEGKLEVPVLMDVTLKTSDGRLIFSSLSMNINNPNEKNSSAARRDELVLNLYDRPISANNTGNRLFHWYTRYDRDGWPLTMTEFQTSYRHTQSNAGEVGATTASAFPGSREQTVQFTTHPVPATTVNPCGMAEVWDRQRNKCWDQRDPAFLAVLNR